MIVILPFSRKCEMVSMPWMLRQRLALLCRAHQGLTTSRQVLIPNFIGIDDMEGPAYTLGRYVDMTVRTEGTRADPKELLLLHPTYKKVGYFVEEFAHGVPLERQQQQVILENYRRLIPIHNLSQSDNDPIGHEALPKIYSQCQPYPDCFHMTLSETVKGPRVQDSQWTVVSP
jgi:hypothetical protein